MATSPNANPTQITPPYVPLIDPRTGLIDRAWYMFFLSLFNAAQTAIANEDFGPNAGSLSASLEAAIDRLTQELQTQPVSVVEQVQPLLDALAQKLDTLPSPQAAELQTRVAAVEQELQTLPRPALGSMAALQQDNVPWLTFDETPQSVPPTVGTVAWDGGTTLGVQATTGVLIRVGESEYIYAKASAAITKGQVCYHTGAVGSSGVITAAPTPLALADPNQIVGVAAETIALNGFGLIQISGDLRGFNTTGASVGEVWADGDALYYNPAFVGSFTKVKPSAPNQKTYMGEVTNAGSGGSGSIHVRIVQGTVLGGTDANVQFGTLNNGDLIQYDSALQYWKNVAPSSVSVSTATNLAGGATGSVPYQSAASTTTFLPIGTAAQVLKVNAGATAPEWVSGAALTKVDDTNVTLTLGGTPATSLLAATSLTLGWTGQLAVSRGGTGLSSYTAGDLPYYASGTAFSKLAIGAANRVLTSSGSAPQWVTSLTGLTGVSSSGFTNTSLSSGRLVYSTTGGAQTDSGSLTFDGTNLFAGTTSSGANLRLYASVDGSNGLLRFFDQGGSRRLDIYASGTTAAYISTGGSVPLVFAVNDAECARITAAKSFVAGAQAALATNATDGFLYVPTCAGTPTGTPTAITGMAPIVVNTTNNKLYFYSGGAWRDAGP